MPDTATPLLLAPPSVFAVEDEYQICVAVSGDCTMMVDVGGLCCCDHANGVLRSRRRIHIAHVPAAALDRAGGYTVRLRPILDRRPYFSETGPEQVTSWSFRPIPAGKPVRIINLADAHNLVDEPVAAGAYFGDSLDLLILNGDIPEHAGALSHLLNIYSIAGRITGGARPCVFVRGNHDMRGIHAEDLPEYTPTAAGKSYYTFRTGPVWGIVLDTGEDKSDDHAEYGHTVCCEAFRREEDAFLDAVVRHARHVAAMPVDSDATSEDFNRSAIMYGLAMAYDTACDFMTPDERAAVLAAIRVRGEHFYRHYVKNFECHSMDNHVWQHTFRNFFFTAIATTGDIPEAGKWLRYCYEVWCSRFPILGGEDGGWHDGCSYFEANLVTFIYVPFVLSRLTGVDFFDIPWYRNLPGFLVYSFPKDSYATGYGDDYEKLRTPPAQYMGFADALARETGSGEARWYADRLIGDDPATLRRARTFRIYRMLTDCRIDDVQPVAPQPMTSRFYPDAGFSLMHTDPADAANDLMATFIGVPFGATGHAHAAHNGFTISYGGRQLFGGTGYYSNFNDKHTLMHYRTRGHNTLLVDGLAQCIGENGYGWLPRFADTPALTYTLGDATHAYDKMRTPFWIDRMKRSGVDYTPENGFGDPGVTRFRRHFLFLKPDIIVIYDELEAREAVSWTWLLHSHHPMTRLSEQAVEAGNGAATGRMDLFTTGVLELNLTDQFFSPAVNWKQRAGADGKPLVYSNHWHAEFTTARKSPSQRFLALFRITPEGREPLPCTCDGAGRIEVGGWVIEAQLDASQPARLTVTDAHGNAVLYNTGASTVGGSTLIRQPGAPERELVDEIPVSLR